MGVQERPLYNWKNDQKPGDITGDGVGGVWHIVQP
jgi:predicted lipoprotein with Yx(FWY)xxD motif